MAHALAKHPDCAHAAWYEGVQFVFVPVIIVKLWRNEECYLAGDPPRYVEGGYPC